MLSQFILKIIDFFYPPFRRLMPIETFRYAACGGGNTLLSLCIFTLCYNFVYDKTYVELPYFTLQPHSASLFTAFIITFPIGFFLARNIVFSTSTLRGRKQLFRYFITAMLSLVLNYINLKIMVEYWHFYPSVAQVINTVVVVTVSFLSQKYFAFRKQRMK